MNATDVLRTLAGRMDGLVLGTPDMLREAADEIDKLREERDMYRDLVGMMDHPDLNVQLQAENANLRELCASLYEFAMSEYPDGTELNFADRMRELGVEV